MPNVMHPQYELFIVRRYNDALKTSTLLCDEIYDSRILANERAAYLQTRERNTDIVYSVDQYRFID